MSVPKLRFKEFDGDWVSANIQSLVDQNILDKPMDGNHGEIHPTSADYVENGIPFVMATDVFDGKVHLNKSKKITKEQADTLRKGFSIEGDILLTHKATIGNVAKVSELETPYIMLTPQVTYYRILDQEKLLADFMKSNFESVTFQNELIALCTGATRLYIGISEQRKLPFSYPSKPEQTKIASFLSAVDEKISQLTQKHELLSQYKQGMMQKLFSQQIRFKADDGSEFGEWEGIQANELFENYSNKNHDGTLTILAATQDKGVVPRDEIDIDIKSSDASVLSYKIIEKGNFVISLRSFQGGIEYSNYRGICSPAYTVLKSIKPIASGFYKDYLKTNDFIQRLSATVIGIRDGKQISYQAFSTLMIDYPSVEEQTKIANFLTAIDQKIEVVAQQIEQAKQWKKGLLQQMFV